MEGDALSPPRRTPPSVARSRLPSRAGKGGTEHLSDLSGFDAVDADDAGDNVILGPDNKPAPTGPAGNGSRDRSPL